MGSALLLPNLCCISFLYVIYLLGKSKMDMCKRQALHQGCPFSGRQRLYNNGKPGNLDLFTSGVCIYAIMPALYVLPLVLIQIIFVKSIGSIFALTLAAAMLVIGWEYRMLERFCC